METYYAPEGTKASAVRAVFEETHDGDIWLRETHARCACGDSFAVDVYEDDAQFAKVIYCDNCYPDNIHNQLF
jgi:hypothetical protein